MSPAETRQGRHLVHPDFLGLTAEGGIWDQLGGAASAGEDIIIGVIDSGIWPESLSFADRVTNGSPEQGPGRQAGLPADPRLARQVRRRARRSRATLCNQKLIGARYFNAGQGGNAGINADRPWEFNSARDYNGHGTHTSSTAGGNYDIPTTGAASLFGPISGMAPRARIAMYKALWSTEDAATASGSTPDLVAAIDQAVADGVDVINYSISGTTTNFADPVEISFLFAADAGVFVAASAGNSGPTDRHGRPSQPVDHHGRGRHPQPRRPGLRDPGQRHDLQRRLGGAAGGHRPAHQRRRTPALAGADRDGGWPCASRPATTTARPCSTRPRWPARSWSATAASTPGSTRAWRSRRPAASAMILVNT